MDDPRRFMEQTRPDRFGSAENRTVEVRLKIDLSLGIVVEYHQRPKTIERLRKTGRQREVEVSLSVPLRGLVQSQCRSGSQESQRPL